MFNGFLTHLPLLQYVVPVPCTPEFMDSVDAWVHLNEDEDEAAMLLKHLGVGGGATQWKVSALNPGTPPVFGQRFM